MMDQEEKNMRLLLALLPILYDDDVEEKVGAILDDLKAQDKQTHMNDLQMKNIEGVQ